MPQKRRKGVLKRRPIVAPDIPAAEGQTHGVTFNRNSDLTQLPFFAGTVSHDQSFVFLAPCQLKTKALR